jgi:hypothetical protein
LGQVIGVVGAIASESTAAVCSFLLGYTLEGVERCSTNAKPSQTVLTCCDIESRLIGASFPLIRIRLYIRSMKRTDKTNVDPFSLVFIEQFSFLFPFSNICLENPLWVMIFIENLFLKNRLLVFPPKKKWVNRM